MAKVCDVCGKTRNTGYRISHSHIKTKKRWNANIQKVRVELKNGLNRKINVCTRCLKAGRVKRAIS